MRTRAWEAVLLGLAGCAQEGVSVDCDAPAAVCTIAGTGEPGFSGEGEDALSARLYAPMDVVAEPERDSLVIVDWNNHKLRRMHDGLLMTILGTTAPLEGPGDPAPEGTPGVELGINHPVQAEFGPDGTLYVAGWHNHHLLRWVPESGLVFKVAGTSIGFSGDGGLASQAQLAFPTSIAFDDNQNLYFVDQGNLRIRRISPDGIIDTVAGTGALGMAGDGGDPMGAEFAFVEQPGMQNIPAGALEISRNGVVWIADSFNGCLRDVDWNAHEIDTMATSLSAPRDVEIGPDRRIYVIDTGDFVVRAIDPDSGDSEIVVGTGEEGFGLDGTPALQFDLGEAHGLDFAADGAMLVADTYNHRILRVAPGW